MAAPAGLDLPMPTLVVASGSSVVLAAVTDRGQMKLATKHLLQRDMAHRGRRPLASFLGG
jgi:hypothetical protein